MGTRVLGRQFGWLWAAYAASTIGTFFAFDAFPLIAILVLDAGPAQVSILAAAGLAIAAIVAVPFGPWIDGRRKRRVMVAMDLLRFTAVMSIPAAYGLGVLTFAQLLLVTAVVGASDIAFTAASGAYLKSLVPREHLLIASGRFESTAWTATALGPPLGGLAIAAFGPVTTVVANAVSYVLSAMGLTAIGGRETPPPARQHAHRVDVLTGWRDILAHPTLRPLFFNTVLVNALIMAAAPLMAVLMLGRLGFAPWQYGLAFGAPCIGGLVGSRLAQPLVTRFGQHRVLRVAGTLRVCWPLALAFVVPGPAGLILVIVTELGLITCMGVFNPVFAAYRLEQTPTSRVARTLSAWSITSKAVIASMTALWGLLAAVTGPRVAIAAAGVFILATPVLLLRRDSGQTPASSGSIRADVSGRQYRSSTEIPSSPPRV